MLNFCTLFNSAYLSRGVAMYRSLEATCPSFHLYIVAFDDATYSFLSRQGKVYPHLTVISLSAFESPELLAVKPGRSLAEYCWTSTPAVILYCIQQFKLPHCTYIDADLYFYNDPAVLIEEMGEQSVLISAHRYTKEYDQSAYSGVYCVQFMCFKDTAEGMAALTWWRDRCIEWCYARAEDGKFGDQKYLDDWPQRFKGVHELQHIGGGVAPWNVQQYVLGEDKTVVEKNSGKKQELVFFHFHGLQFYTNDAVALCGALYEIDPIVKQQLYFPYITQLIKTSKEIKAAGFEGDSNGARATAPTALRWMANYWWKMLQQIKNGQLPLYRLIFTNFKLHYHIHHITNGVPD